MSQRTKIEWCDATWNPTSGCTPVSKGCEHCWAKRMALRQRGRNGYDARQPFRPTFHPERLDQLFHWEKPRRIAVSLMGDLFHEQIHDYMLERIFAVMRMMTRHIFLVLTKRPERMKAFLAA